VNARSQDRLGWRTDDFLVVGDRTADACRKLAGQVKRSFTVSDLEPPPMVAERVFACPGEPHDRAQPPSFESPFDRDDAMLFEL